jgi:hypothetical protein
MGDSPASLLATMNCVMMDRDDYIWCDLNIGVNGTRPRRAKILICAVDAVNNRHPARDRQPS